jgi:hypothetical protein
LVLGEVEVDPLNSWIVYSVEMVHGDGRYPLPLRNRNWEETVTMRGPIGMTQSKSCLKPRIWIARFRREILL